MKAAFRSLIRGSVTALLAIGVLLIGQQAFAGLF